MVHQWFFFLCLKLYWYIHYFERKRFMYNLSPPKTGWQFPCRMRHQNQSNSPRRDWIPKRGAFKNLKEFFKTRTNFLWENLCEFWEIAKEKPIDDYSLQVCPYNILVSSEMFKDQRDIQHLYYPCRNGNPSQYDVTNTRDLDIMNENCNVSMMLFWIPETCFETPPFLFLNAKVA